MSTTWIAVDLTCRLQGGRPHRRSSSLRYSAQLTRIFAGHWTGTVLAAVVPPCTGQCRLVRVIGVLMYPATETPPQQIMLLSFHFSGALSHPRALTWKRLQQPGSRASTLLTDCPPCL